jgi:hypothetical protein
MYTLGFLLLTFQSKKSDSAIPSQKERRLLCLQNMGALFDRPVEMTFTPLGTYGAGFELTKALFLVRAEMDSPVALKSLWIFVN